MLEQDETARDSKVVPGHLVRAFLLPIVVLLPTLGAAFAADKRFNIYRFGGDYSQRPWGVITDQVRNTDYYLTLGNFRPLGRMVERSQDLLTFQLAELLSLPFHIAMRVVNIAAVGLLCILSVLTVETLTSRTRMALRHPSQLGLLLPLIFAALLIVVNGNSSVVLFTDLYATSVGVVLGVAMLAARHGFLMTSHLAAGRYVLALLLGAGLASFNEVAALALPLMVVAVLVRGHLTMRLSMRQLLGTAALKVTAVTWLGFLVVALPVRAEIARRCAQGQCYAASEISVSSDTVVTLGHRLASALPGGHVYWLRSGEISDWRTLVHLPTLLLIAALALMAVQSARQSVRARGVPSRAQFAPIIFGAAAIVMGALMASLSKDLQQQVRDGLPVGAGWRETLMVIAGLSMLLAAVGALAAQVATQRSSAGVHPVIAGGLAALVFAAAVAVLGNATWTQRQIAGAEPALHNQISINMISPSADEGIRCGLFDRFTELNDDAVHRARLAEALDAAEQSLRGRVWCEEDR
jgi:hypothetical protein